MKPSVSYRLLREDDLPAIHQTFLAAFADYEMPVDRSLEQTRRMLVRRGIQYRVSVGAFEGEEMVAVMATGFGEYRGEPAAYDIFTGVTPGFRGRGIAGGMLDYAAPALARQGAERFVLEVIETNAPAVTAYERAGFETVRELSCFAIPTENIHPASPPDGVVIDPIERPDWEVLRNFWDWEPSWQNSIASVERGVDDMHVLGAFRGGKCIGYGAVEPDTGDVAQMAVARESRRQGVARALFAAMARILPPRTDTLRVLNVDAESDDDLSFYDALGADEFVRQFEMHRVI